MKTLSRLRKMTVTGIFAISTLLAFALLPPVSSAQVGDETPDRLRVGTTLAPPFAMKSADGYWEGVSIDLWRTVADELGVLYDVLSYGTMEELMDALGKGQLDMALALAATEEREITIDFSHFYFRSGSGIAVSSGRQGAGWQGLIMGLNFSGLFGAIGLLMLLWVVAGTVVWVFERRRNQEMFGGKTIKGIGHGVWWAAVTMTTVGYGDKAPKSVGGRVVAVVWMLASIVIISGFTGSIAASLTTEKLSGKVRGQRDLHYVRVGTFDGSETLARLTENGIAPVPYPTLRSGLQALVDNDIDAFVFDQLVLKHLARTEFPGRVQVLADTFDHYNVAMGLQQNSFLRERINRALLKAVDTKDWHRILMRYTGPDP